MSFAPSHLPHVFGLLDIGTSKIVCLMLEHVSAPDERPYRIIGFGHQRSRGLKASVIVDADAAEDAVRTTVAQAQHMAGVGLEHVVIAAACGRLMSTHVAAGLTLAPPNFPGRRIAQSDVDQVLEAGRTHAERDDRAVLNLNTLGARVDHRPHSGDVTGASGYHLSLDVHAVAADRAPLQHLLHVVERCQLHVMAIAAAPLAAAYAVTTPEQRHAGTVVIDMGAGSTGLAVFVAGALVCAHVVPIGANHLTFDLIRALGISHTEAERIKKNYAIEALAHATQSETTIDLAHGATNAEAVSASIKQVTRADISKIFTSRLDGLFRQLGHRIEQLALPQPQHGDVVLTGGGSLMSGLPSLAAAVLARPVRIAAPGPHCALPASLQHPTFATAAGLESIAVNAALGLRLDTRTPPVRFKANGTGLRQSF